MQGMSPLSSLVYVRVQTLEHFSGILKEFVGSRLRLEDALKTERFACCA